MSGFNKVIMLGNLTRDPALSYLPSQTPVVEFGLATNRKWNDKDGSPKEEVCFVDCRVFGKQAETLNKYCSKGRPLLIEGRLTLDQWDAPDGTKRSKHRITIEKFTFVGDGSSLGGRKEEQNQQPESEQPQNNPQPEDIPF
ncbi:MAG: single-stranded DNA-binding protein [FCB group bacterium]|nr:single-stranded DNA-binding protein [FCB group bacterium]